MPDISTDICIIGAGSGGLSMASGAVQLGAKVVLIESHKMGGDCLNYGCIPSKALIHFANKFKVSNQNNASIEEVNKYIQGIISDIEPHDSVERFTSLGVNVILGAARFVDKSKVVVNDSCIIAKRFIIATGSKPFIPNINGLDNIKYYTNETIFSLDELPQHLAILGAGPIGCEIAQAFRRLGSAVTLIARSTVLSKEHPSLSTIVKQQLESEGCRIITNANVISCNQSEGSHVKINVNHETVTATHLLVAVGRTPNIYELGLEKAFIQFDENGIKVDASLRTSNRRVYSIGDATPYEKFTHVAGYQAGILIKSMLFKIKATYSNTYVPRVTYTDPEIAHIGMLYSQAKAKKINCQEIVIDWHTTDRGKTDEIRNGLLIVVVDSKGYILGVSIVGPNAGEHLLPWTIIMQNNLKLKAIANCIVAYPTMSEIHKRVVSEFYKPKLFNNKVRRLVKFLWKFTF